MIENKQQRPILIGSFSGVFSGGVQSPISRSASPALHGAFVNLGVTGDAGCENGQKEYNARHGLPETRIRAAGYSASRRFDSCADTHLQARRLPRLLQ